MKADPPATAFPFDTFSEKCHWFRSAPGALLTETLKPDSNILTLKIKGLNDAGLKANFSLVVETIPAQVDQEVYNETLECLLDEGYALWSTLTPP